MGQLEGALRKPHDTPTLMRKLAVALEYPFVKKAFCCTIKAGAVKEPFSTTDEDEQQLAKGMAKAKEADIELDCKVPNAVANPETDLILNMLDPVNGPAAGLPYQVHWLGPPRPPCEQERLATVQALNKIAEQVQPDPEISTILKLVASVFKAPAALCALFDEQRVFISEQEGNVIPCGDFPWRWTLCGWSMAFKNPQVLVIQDTLQDARFYNNNKVQAFPFVRFYCGAPLIAANGHRLGTLCFADVKPRKFDMASCVMMNNLSELVVRQLEKDIALKLKEKDNKQLLDTYKQLQRTIDCYDNTVVLLDTQEPGWRVVYSNAAWTKQTGLSRNSLLGKSLTEVVECTDGTQLPSPKLLEVVKKRRGLTVPMARLKDPGATKTFTLSFKPAGRSVLDESTIPIGVPSFLSLDDGEEDVSHRFYFMTLYAVGRSPDTVHSTPVASSWNLPSGFNLLNTTSSSWTTSLSSSSDSECSVIAGLELAHLLGRGSYGWVYYGTWFGTPVAVKIIDEDVRKRPALSNGGMAPKGAAGHGQEGPSHEALLAHELKHPYVVSTMKYATRMVPFKRAPDYADYAAASMMTTAMTPISAMDPCDPPSRHSSMYGGAASPTAPRGTSAGGASLCVSETSQGQQQLEGAQGRWAVIDAGLQVQDEEQHLSSASIQHDAETLRALQVKPDGWVQLEDRSTPHDSCNHAEQQTRCSPTHTSALPSMTQQTWLMMEYCDKGCVQDAIDRGWLRTARACLKSEANMPAVVMTAFEIASALAYLHDTGIIHGDLTGWNVMLSSSGSTAAYGDRGFVAKVADFGLARSMELRTRITTKNYGTLTHMPPELLTAGTASFAMDVYSYGVLLWQMYTGSRPWSGLTHAQIILKVVEQRKQLVWDDHVPPEYRQLAEECMAYEPEARPSFKDIMERLQAMRDELDV